MKTKIKKILVVTILITLFTSTTYADDQLDVKNRVNNMQGSSSQIGILGEIFTKIFDTNGKIKEAFLSITNTATNGYIPMWDNLQLINSPIFYLSGKIGIGTINPSQALEVNGNLHVSGNITLSGGIDGNSINNSTIDTNKIVDNTITETDINDSFKARDSDKLDGIDSTRIMTQGTDIPDYADLNTYVTTGLYHQNANAYVLNGTNYPSVRAGMLEVSEDGNMVYQKYTDYFTGEIYSRTKYNGTWYVWRKIYNEYNNPYDTETEVDAAVANNGYMVMEDATYDGLKDLAGSTSNRIRTTGNGILPKSSGGVSSVGSLARPFLTIYGKTIYESGSTLSSKYLGISNKAADSDLLDGKNSTTTLGNDDTTIPTSKAIKDFINLIGLNDLSDAISSVGLSNLFLGYTSGISSTGGWNTGVGVFSMFSNTTGNSNTAIGNASMYANTNGSENTSVGEESLFNNTNGTANSAFGIYSLYSNSVGSSNAAYGAYSLTLNLSGNNNTANGFFSLTNNETGNNNTAVGYATLSNNNTGNGNVAIGNEAGYFETGSNKLYIDNSSTSSPLIYGDFSTNKLTINGSLKIGVATDTTCDASNKGFIRYDSTLNHFYGCNGTTWKQLDN